MPDVTVLMTVYNGLPYLSAAIESILGQTFCDFEFLIVNDCSTDHSRDVILGYNDPRIRLIDNTENINQTRSLNRGLEATRTELVARMDADDISHPHRLEKQFKYLSYQPDIVAVGTNLRFIDTRGKVIGDYKFPEDDLTLRWMQLFDCPVSCGAVMFKRSVIWDRLGGFEPSIRYSQDWELWSRVIPEYRIGNVPEMLVDVRQHPGASSSAASVPMLEEQKKIIRENPKRILGIKDDSIEWLDKVESLLEKRLRHPEDRLSVIETLFERFCELHPEAKNSSAVIKILARQYIEVLYYTQIPRQILLLKRIWTSLSQSPRLSSIFLYELGSAVRLVPTRLRYWIPRNLFGVDI